MKHLPVNWREGQFLLPQSFQAADRYWFDHICCSQQWDHPYYYGVRAIAYSFAGNALRVDMIHARFRDGTLVQRDTGSPPLEIALDNVLKDEPQRIYLCVPQAKLGEVNVRIESSADDSARKIDQQSLRFVSKTQNLPDENESGGEEVEVEFRDLDVSLKSEAQDRTGYAALPIASVRRPSLGEVGPQLNELYIPPVLSIDAWGPLGLGIVRGVHDLVMQYSDKHALALRDVAIRDRILDVVQSTRISYLDRLNEANAVLGIMIPPAQGVHPYQAYAELCRILGQFSIFTPEKKAERIPAYDHDNLGEIFREIAERIRRIIEAPIDGYLQKNFVWKGDIMLAELAPEWFRDGTEWYIGVERGNEVSPNDCRRLLSPANNFLWKFGSDKRDIYKLTAVGLDIKPEDNPSHLLPPYQYWSYWRVPTDRSDPNFNAVFDLQRIAFYMKDPKNSAFNSSAYTGTSRFPVMDSASPGRIIEFKLSLFGLRR
jgi:type VI secretion system protein ImpJ